MKSTRRGATIVVVRRLGATVAVWWIVAGCQKTGAPTPPDRHANEAVANARLFDIEPLPGEREPTVAWNVVRLPAAARDADVLEPFFWGSHVVRNRCRAPAAFVIAPESIEPWPDAPKNTLQPGEAVRVSLRDGDRIYLETSRWTFAGPVEPIDFEVGERTTTFIGPGPCTDLGVVAGVWPQREPQTDPVIAELEAIIPRARAASRRGDAEAAGRLWSRVAAMVFVPEAPDNATAVAWLEAERHFRWAWDRLHHPNDLRVAHELLLHLRDHPLENSGVLVLEELRKTHAADLERVGIHADAPGRFALLFFDTHPQGTGVRLDGSVVCREPCLLALASDRDPGEIEFVDPSGARISGPGRPTFSRTPKAP